MYVLATAHTKTYKHLIAHKLRHTYKQKKTHFLNKELTISIFFLIFTLSDECKGRRHYHVIYIYIYIYVCVCVCVVI